MPDAGGGTGRVSRGPSPHIGLIGWYGHSNLGDELMLARLVHVLSHATGHPPTVLCDRPEHVTIAPAREVELGNYGWTANPYVFSPSRRTVLSCGPRWVRGWLGTRRQYARALRDLDHVVIGGGTFLGTSRHVHDVWAHRIRLARAHAQSVVLYGIGVDRLSPSVDLSRLAAIIDAADLVVVRDAYSMGVLSSLSSRGTVRQGTDILYALFPDAPKGDPSAGQHQCGEAIALSPRAGGMWYGSADYQAQLIAMFVGIAERLYARGDRPFLLPFSDEMDLDLCREIAKSMSGSQRLEIAAVPRGLEELKAQLEGAGSVIAMPLHCILLSLICGKRVIPLPYHVKCQELCSEVGVEGISLDANSTTLPDVGTVLERLDDAPSFYETQGAHIRQRLVEHKRLALASEALLVQTLSGGKPAISG